MTSLSPDDLAQAQGRAFFMIQGMRLRWGLKTQSVLRITSEDEADLPPSLIVPADFLPLEEDAVGRWTLIVQTRSGQRALSVSRFLELVPAEQVNLQPLPPLCEPVAQRDPQAGVRITHVALAAASDHLLFLLIDPAA